MVFITFESYKLDIVPLTCHVFHVSATFTASLQREKLNRKAPEKELNLEDDRDDRML